MKTLKLFHVDAFTSAPFRGNPAAVIPLDGPWLDESLTQSIAGENNVSETAFFRPASNGSDFELRWFTPTVEVDLCGHATLSAAHVLWNHLGFKGDTIRFSTRRLGVITVTRDADRIALDLPAYGREPADITNTLIRGLGREPIEAYRSGHNLLCVFESKKSVHEVDPDFATLRAVIDGGVIVTAPGAGHDYVVRFFAPNLGVDEDPVTGSAQCSLVPYWAEKFGRKELTAHQVSRRGGRLWCKLEGDRVRVSGHAVTYLEGAIRLPE
ncbi:MAG: PhzF family phenazine biosynthesis protein [Leptolyngbya sp. PLA3]|nr:MAG: PhzF family phenazine biosynthesis protein [Cyanobacteria bacterium CYA]MCE7969487.1 PhzF family phenazine biosynthesis protein [Leptolyngbya sp. PL-A3]